MQNKQGLQLTEQIEHILCNGQPLAYLIRAETTPQKTTFVTPSEFPQQVGFVVYPEGDEIPRHIHVPVERHLTGTSEVLLLRSGSCEVDIYNDDLALVASRELYPGDILVIVAGGHGFRMLKDTVFVEIKQGPYTGLTERRRF